MESQAKSEADRNILDEKLTELALLAKRLCPEGKIEVTTVRYEDEDGRIKVFPPPCLSEADEEALEETLSEKCIDILEETGLFILCATFDRQAQ
jgi:hypothetical protein